MRGYGQPKVEDLKSEVFLDTAPINLGVING